jgi:hypothetical protein
VFHRGPSRKSSVDWRPDVSIFDLKELKGPERALAAIG